MNRVLIYSTAICPFCVAAKNFLVGKGLTYDEIRVDRDPAALAEMIERTNRRSVPQIIINDHHVGGYDELISLDRDGGLSALLIKE